MALLYFTSLLRFQELSAPDRDCSLFFGLSLSEECDSDVLRCRFSVSYLPTTPSLEAQEEEKEEEGDASEENVSVVRRRLSKEAKSFSLTREFQDFKVYYLLYARAEEKSVHHRTFRTAISASATMTLTHFRAIADAAQSLEFTLLSCVAHFSTGFLHVILQGRELRQAT